MTIRWEVLGIVVLGLSGVLPAAPPSEELQVLPARSPAGPARQMVKRHLQQMVAAADARRRQAFEALETPEQIQAYCDRHRSYLLAQLGQFPQRTPLAATTLGKLEGDGFRVEKILFASRPQHFVSALLYLPAGSAEPPYPGVLIPCGHSSNGKAYPAYQKLAMLLARNGIAAFCYDPIGQGERYQLLDAQGRPQHKATEEHTLVGVGSILVGRNTAHYRVWDGMRALDYLAGREEVDANRLGCAGNSGGGTLTEYLMALDERIVAAAPGCSVTTFRRKIETIGPGDAEQNIYGQLAVGLDDADYFHLRAPRPALICAATRDFVDIAGTWDVFREAKRLYSRLGYHQQVDLIEVDRKHGMSQPLREAITHWMLRWLAGIDRSVREPELVPFDEKELWCTPQGQVQLLPGAKSVMDLNRRRYKDLAAARERLWSGDREKALAEVRRHAAVRPLDELREPSVTHHGRVSRDHYRIEKLVLESEPGIHLPALLFVPERTSGGFYLYLHEHGKAADAGPGGPIEKLVLGGRTVLAVDLRGMGETGPDGENLWGGDWDDIFVGYLLARPVLGMRAEDTLIAARWLAQQISGEDSRGLHVIAIGRAGPPAVHAVALENVHFASLQLRDTTTSWSPVLTEPGTRGQLVHALHGALEAYDLSDLIQRYAAEAAEVNRK